MQISSRNILEFDPEYTELKNFLIERTKNAKASMNLTQLAEEFKEDSGSSRGISCLLWRISTFRSKIHLMDSIDAAEKVRMLVALNGSIDKDFLDELRNDAVVEVDGKNRIITYRANDGSLELEGDYSSFGKMRDSLKSKKIENQEDFDDESMDSIPKNPGSEDFDNGSDSDCNELMNFLIERTKDSKSPLNIAELARKYKEKSGSSKNISWIVQRIRTFRERVSGLDTIDTETKVKMMFALSVSIDEHFLNGLRKDAVVEVDGNYRIIKYRANDGSLELKGEHWSGKRRFLWDETNVNEIQSFEDSDENERDDREKSVDPSFRRRSARKITVKQEISAGNPEIVTTRSGRVSKSRSARKITVKQEISAGNPEIVTTRSGRVSKKKINFGDDEIDHDLSRKSLKKKRMTGLTSSKPESKPFHGSIRYTKELLNPMDGTIPVKVENPIEMEDVKPKFTSKLKFLEAIKSLVISLDTPTLSRIQSKIQKKIWLIGGSNCGISNDEMIPAMDLLVARISNHSISNLSETVQSVSLKEFLCYLKAVILNSKLEGLEDLLEKIKEKNKMLAMRDKRIPVENVASVLQDTLNNIGF